MLTPVPKGPTLHRGVDGQHSMRSDDEVLNLSFRSNAAAAGVPDVELNWLSAAHFAPPKQDVGP